MKAGSWSLGIGEAKLGPDHARTSIAFMELRALLSNIYGETSGSEAWSSNAVSSSVCSMTFPSTEARPAYRFQDRGEAASRDGVFLGPPTLPARHGRV
jgi:hypothetical protein